MNAHCGRFNRTLQESFVDFHEALLFTNVGAFNRAPAGWLVFYNTERPRQALTLRSPVQSLFISHPERQMLWTYTLRPLHNSKYYRKWDFSPAIGNHLARLKPHFR